ncbi:MAG: hypothetical protein NZM18_03640 [Thermoflexales bacterium]|nr:hypothetical protein [Thermoflexales bacterium]MDW8350619.1 hypothetical protein [Anaerolineae bacterium]
MNRQEILLLQQMRSLPSVTITMPTHRTSPDNKQDAIRLKNLVVEATNRLLKDFPKREVEPLLKRMDELASDVDHAHNLDGLAMFVNRDFGRVVKLPFALKERVEVGDGFATRDLVFAMNRTPRYWVLSLSEKATRLYEATRDDLIEITAGAFPMAMNLPGGALRLPGGEGINPSKQSDHFHEQFFRAVDQEYDKVTKDDRLPLAVLGVDRYLGFFRKFSAKNDVIAEIKGNYDHLSAHDLGKLVWPVVEEAFDRRRAQVFDRLNDAIGARKFVSTIGEAWRYAHEGRGALLLLEEGYHQPARLSDDGMNILLSDDPTDLDVMDDAADVVVEEVLQKGGQVVFVPDGSLAEHGRVALILRY